MERSSYLLHIGRIKHHPRLIEKERLCLDGVIQEISSGIKAAITPRTAVGLLWSLALQECRRTADTIEHLTTARISDFTGHARYLRAVAASIPFQSAELRDDPKTQELLEQCDVLWQAIAHRELLTTLSHRSTGQYKKRHIAASMSLLGAFQQDLRYVEQVESRLQNVYEPFSREVIVPALGLSVDEIVRGFQLVRETVADRLATADDLTRPMVNKWQEFRELVSSGTSDSDLDAFVMADSMKGQIADSFRQGIETANAVMLFAPPDLEAVLDSQSPRFFAEFSFIPGELNKEFARVIVNSCGSVF